MNCSKKDSIGVCALSAVLLMLLSTLPAAAQISYRWTPIPVDSTLDNIKDLRATEIIGRYADKVEPLYEIIGYSDAEYGRGRPEGELSDMAVDIIRSAASAYDHKTVDIALFNFGGIRTSLPKGAVRTYDIYSIFPFNNSIVIFDINGSDFRSFIERSVARHRLQILSGCRIEILDGKVEKLFVGDVPLDDGKTYRMASIDFLLDGGDGVDILPSARNLKVTGIYVRQAITDYLRAMMARGEIISLSCDGRVIERKSSSDSVRESDRRAVNSSK